MNKKPMKIGMFKKRFKPICVLAKNGNDDLSVADSIRQIAMQGEFDGF